MRLTALQLPARWNQRDAQLALVEQLLADGPTDLVLLPEASLTGYVSPRGDFDVRPFAEALNGPTERRALGVMPDPLPKEAPVPRVTLSRAAIVSARALMIAITGDEKKAVLERAIAEGASSNLPVGRVLADVELPVDIHWCAA